MGKLLAVALVLAAVDLARAEEKGTEVSAPAAAQGAKAPAPAGKPAKKGRKKALPGAKGEQDATSAKGGKAPAPAAAAENKPCEPVKPCPID